MSDSEVRATRLMLHKAGSVADIDLRPVIAEIRLGNTVYMIYLPQVKP
jgi:hypothetical protein